MSRPSANMTKLCKNCGEWYPIKPSRYDRSRFCGDECMKEYRGKFSRVTLKSEIDELRYEVNQLRKLCENREKLMHPNFKEK